MGDTAPPTLPTWQEKLYAWGERGVHAGMVLAAAYVAVNPKYAWVVPALQALGQSMPQPR